MKKFEELEHTADLGLRVYGNTFADVLVNAAEGMFWLIGRARFQPSEICSLSVEIANETDQSAEAPWSKSYEQLLYRWLKRLLLEFNLRSFFPVKFTVEITPGGCRGKLSGGTFDPAIHTFHTEIKGVTLHGLKVARINSEWQAEIIFDV